MFWHLMRLLLPVSQMQDGVKALANTGIWHWNCVCYNCLLFSTSYRRMPHSHNVLYYLKIYMSLKTCVYMVQ